MGSPSVAEAEVYPFFIPRLKPGGLPKSYCQTAPLPDSGSRFVPAFVRIRVRGPSREPGGGMEIDPKGKGVEYRKRPTAAARSLDFDLERQPFAGRYPIAAGLLLHGGQRAS